MDVTILRIDGCPNWELAADRVKEAATRIGTEVTIAVRAIGTDDAAVALGFTGSPTVLVRGHNPFGGEPTGELACRRYYTEAGAEGAPSVEQLETALREVTE